MKLANKTVIGLCILGVFMICQNARALKPSKDYKITPDSLDIDFDTLLIQSSHNINLNTWIYAPNPDVDNNTVLILVYPDAGNMSNYIYQSSYLAYAGYTVVTFDYRGFGESSDFDIKADYLFYNEFCSDLIAVVNKVEQKFKEKKIGIWALSMGTIVTAQSFSEIDNKIDFIIGEGFVVDTEEFVNRIQKKKNKTIRLPNSESKYSDLISKIDIPILIFSASEDEYTTTNDALYLKQKLSSDCTIVEYEGQHLGGFYAWPDKGYGQGYIDNINLFIEGI